MKLRFILRDGKKVLQQAKKCPVLYRQEWEDVPLVGFDEATRFTEDQIRDLLIPKIEDDSFPPTGGLSMDRLAPHTGAYEENPLCSKPECSDHGPHWHEKEVLPTDTGACSEGFREPKNTRTHFICDGELVITQPCSDPDCPLSHIK